MYTDPNLPRGTCATPANFFAFTSDQSYPTTLSAIVFMFFCGLMPLDTGPAGLLHSNPAVPDPAGAHLLPEQSR